MRKMKPIEFIAAAVLGSLLLAGAGCGKSGGADNIDGTWVGSDLANPNVQYQITVANGHFEFRGTIESDSFSGNIAVLYTESQPSKMDVTLTAPPQLAGRTALFILDRTGDELKLAWAPPGSYRRPSSFDPDPSVRIVTFKPQ